MVVGSVGCAHRSHDTIRYDLDFSCNEDNSRTTSSLANNSELFVARVQCQQHSPYTFERLKVSTSKHLTPVPTRRTAGTRPARLPRLQAERSTWLLKQRHSDFGRQKQSGMESNTKRNSTVGRAAMLRTFSYKT